MTEKVTNPMGLLKSVVAILGVLILVMIALIVWAVLRRAEPPTIGGTITLPAGAEIQDTSLAGDRLVLRIKLPDGTERLVTVDATSGKQLGTLSVDRR